MNIFEFECTGILKWLCTGRLNVVLGQKILTQIFVYMYLYFPNLINEHIKGIGRSNMVLGQKYQVLKYLFMFYIEWTGILKWLCTGRLNMVLRQGKLTEIYIFEIECTVT